jgi:hypothetical protein
MVILTLNLLFNSTLTPVICQLAGVLLLHPNRNCEEVRSSYSVGSPWPLSVQGLGMDWQTKDES